MGYVDPLANWMPRKIFAAKIDVKCRNVFCTRSARQRWADFMPVTQVFLLEHTVWFECEVVEDQLGQAYELLELASV